MPHCFPVSDGLANKWMVYWGVRKWAVSGLVRRYSLLYGRTFGTESVIGNVPEEKAEVAFQSLQDHGQSGREQPHNSAS